MRKLTYPSDLSDEEWRLINGLIPKKPRVGRPRTVSMRAVIDGIFYVLHTGCPWRFLPHSYPHPEVCFYYFSKWSEQGVWAEICHALHKTVRIKSGKDMHARVGIVDSQSTKASQGEERGFDGFKRVTGRKRNIIVDGLGIILFCLVHAANVNDSVGGKELLKKLPTEVESHLEKVIADQGYRGRFKDEAEYYHGYKVELTNQGLNGTNLKPKRWIVERTFAWFNNSRRLSRDYERKVRNSESMIYLSQIPILLRRICA